MIIDIQKFIDILLMSGNELKRTQFSIQDLEYTNLITFMIECGFIKNKNSEQVINMHRFGELTCKGQEFLSVFRNPDINNEILNKIKELNTDSLEVAYNLAVQKLSKLD